MKKLLSVFLLLFAFSTSVNAGPHGALLAPSQAAAAGFHTLKFNSNFVNLNTIDTARTQSPGFAWYLNFIWPHACDAATGGSGNTACGPWLTFNSQSAANLSVVSNNLHSVAGALVSNLNVASATASGTTFNGNAYGPGFYIEGRQNWTTTPAFASTALYLLPTEFYTGSAVKFAEIDFMESFSSTQSHQTILLWDLSTATPTPTSVNDTVNAGTINVGDFHTWGVLWQTIAQHGGGTGLITFYMDNVFQSSIAYVVTDPLAILDTQHFVLLWKSDPTNPSPANLNFYRVWSTPYLLKRDLNHDNDNTPMFINQAA